QQNIDWLVANASALSQMTIAPELPNSIELIARAAKAGICISLGHTEATEEQAAEAVGHGARKVSHLFNAMSAAAKRGLFRDAVQMGSGSPAAMLGLERVRGRIARGLAADLVRFDDDFRVLNVWVAGNRVH